ncbi:MAG: FKBP-type peptidyl-prolyl cis-trans isomerase [Erysipelotrichales bacterium]
MSKTVKTYLVALLALITIGSGLYIVYDKSYPEIELMNAELLKNVPPKRTPVKGKAIDGHMVNIDFTGYVDGKKMDQGGTAKDYNLILGENQFIDGFEEQLIGHKKGDKVDVNVVFPKDYLNKELQGKKAKFEVKVNEVYKVKRYTKVDDELIKLLGLPGVTNVKEYNEYAKQLIDINRIKQKNQAGQQQDPNQQQQQQVDPNQQEEQGGQ